MTHPKPKLKAEVPSVKRSANGGPQSLPVQSADRTCQETGQIVKTQVDKTVQKPQADFGGNPFGQILWYYKCEACGRKSVGIFWWKLSVHAKMSSGLLRAGWNVCYPFFFLSTLTASFSCKPKNTNRFGCRSSSTKGLNMD